MKKGVIIKEKGNARSILIILLGIMIAMICLSFMIISTSPGKIDKELKKTSIRSISNVQKVDVLIVSLYEFYKQKVAIMNEKQQNDEFSVVKNIKKGEDLFNFKEDIFSIGK
jgi:hypothetical protein